MSRHLQLNELEHHGDHAVVLDEQLRLARAADQELVHQPNNSIMALNLFAQCLIKNSYRNLLPLLQPRDWRE